MKHLTRALRLFWITFALLLAPRFALAQADALGILENLDVNNRADNAALIINFSVPVHYVRHFPVGEGDVVQITVRAVTVHKVGDEELQRRESLTWTPTRDLPLLDVTYEGDVNDGPNLIVRFRHPVKFSVTEGDDSRSIIVTVAREPAPPQAPAAPEAAAAAQPVPAMPMLPPVPESKVAGWMDEGRKAMTAGDYPAAIRIFTKALQHPGHKYLPEAKELLGLARERNHQLAHAKAEYEEYLRLYPQGEGAQRVRQRLDALLTAREPGKEKLRAAGGGAPGRSGGMQFNGSISQYYRRDASTTDQQGTVTNQSALTNYLDLGGRMRGERYDVRTQLTGSYIYDFLQNVTGAGTGTGARISALYVDTADRKLPLDAKLGRQSRSSGGVLGRFDGGLFSYGFYPKWKLNLVAGAPVDLGTENRIQTDHNLFGVSVDRSGILPNLDASLFAINQNAAGILDRRAVGGELRYATPQNTLFTLLDYDTSYAVLNTFLALANWQFTGGGAFNMALDYRMSPALTTTNALQGQTVTTLADLLKTYTEDQVRQLARDRTARSKSATLGGNVPLNQKLQLSGDVTLSNLAGTPASGGVPANPGTGNEFIYTVQLIGSSLMKEGDVSILGVSYYDARDFNTTSLILNTRYPVSNDWRINPRLRIDYKTGSSTGNSVIIRPQLRTDYRLKKELTFEMEGGVEWDDQRSGSTAQNSRGYYVSIGYRWTF